MTSQKLIPPTRATLKKYGMDEEIWYNYGDFQDWKCPICRREFTETKRPVIDHEHGIKGWKNMKPEMKRKYVRGLCCNYCNRFRIPKRSKELTVLEIAENTLTYLEDYTMRSNDV